MGNPPIHVLIVDDQAMVRKGLKILLSQYDDIQVIGEAANGLVAVQIAARWKPDVILMDLTMPVMGGIEATQQILDHDSKLRVIILTAHTSNDCFLQAIKAGAMGFLDKTVEPDDLIQSIRMVYSGEPSFDPKLTWTLLQWMNHPPKSDARKYELLSKRETEILKLLSRGKTDHQIAQELVLAEVTIRTHVSRILEKLGLSNRVQATLYSLHSGLVSLNDPLELGYSDV